MKKTLTIGSDLKNLRKVEKLIDDLSAQMGVEKNCYGKLMVSAMEAVNNAVVHGNKANPSKKVRINISQEGSELKIIVEDEGNGFRYDTVPDPTLPENIEKLTGRGVFLMRKLADEVRFNEKGNIVTLLFRNVKS